VKLKRPRLLWISVVDCATTAPRAIAEDYFEIHACTGLAAAQSATDRFAPRVVCCEFEDSQAAQLRAMRAFKLANPSLPLLMLTSQHSEALAVWAFRARVWNYLVKPVPTNELRSNFSILARLISATSGPSRSIEAVGALLPADVASAPGSAGEGSLQAVRALVERQYAEKLRQATVAASCAMSISNFSRAFKAEYGLTFSDYLMRYRIGKACQLLRDGSHNATSAGLAVGFDDASHFARAFRHLLGVSPSMYQRQERLARQSGLYERRARRLTDHMPSSETLSELRPILMVPAGRSAAS
jgi:AraC-like DNA-binding protein